MGYVGPLGKGSHRMPKVIFKNLLYEKKDAYKGKGSHDLSLARTCEQVRCFRAGSSFLYNFPTAGKNPVPAF